MFLRLCRCTGACVLESLSGLDACVQREGGVVRTALICMVCTSLGKARLRRQTFLAQEVLCETGPLESAVGRTVLTILTLHPLPSLWCCESSRIIGERVRGGDTCSYRILVLCKQPVTARVELGRSLCGDRVVHSTYRLSAVNC